MSLATNSTDKLQNCTYSDNPRDYLPDYAIAIYSLLTSLFYCVIIVAIFMNGMVCYVYKKYPEKRNSVDILLVNMAIADIVTNLGLIPYVSVPLSSLKEVSQGVANFFCNVIQGQMIFWIGNGASVFILTTISAQRYMTFKSVVRRQTTTKNNKRAVYVAWAVPFILGIPNTLSRKYNACAAVCFRYWPAYINGTAFSLATTVICFVIPISIMLMTLTAAIKTLWCKNEVLEGRTCRGKARKQTTKILVSLICAFMFCWTPFAVYWIVAWTTDVFPQKGPRRHYYRTMFVHLASLIGLLNTIINPIIYVRSAETFRKRFRRLCRSVREYLTHKRMPLKNKRKETASRTSSSSFHLETM